MTTKHGDKIDFEKIAKRVNDDGEKCDAETVKRLFDSLDSGGQMWVSVSSKTEIEQWAFAVLCNTQPAL